MYEKDVSDLTEQVSRELRSSARSYYKIGIDSFHESRMKPWFDFQPAIGNLCISIELLLKSVVAIKAISLLYTNLTDEAKLLLCHPNSLTAQFNSHSYLSDLRSFTFKSIEPDKAASLFYTFYPESKAEFKSFLSSLSQIRNISVHASVPNFQRYELESIAYNATKLFQTIHDKKVFKYFFFDIDRKTQAFLNAYESEKIKKVKDALEAARKIVKSNKLQPPTHFTNDWDTMDETCPICGNVGKYTGETEEDQDPDNISLTFFCDSFHCDSCGLNLDDYEELELAGMETSLDRSEDVDEWCDQHGYSDHTYEKW